MRILILALLFLACNESKMESSVKYSHIDTSLKPVTLDDSIYEKGELVPVVLDTIIIVDTIIIDTPVTHD